MLNLLGYHAMLTRGGVEDTRLEAKAKAKDTKKILSPFKRLELKIGDAVW